MIVKIKPISSSDISKYEKEMLASDLTLSYSDYLFGAFYGNEIVGWVGVKEYKFKYKFKTAFVLPQYRKKGVYKKLFNHRLQKFNDKPIEAICTPMSYDFYLKNGFVKIKEFKNGCKLVRK